MSLTPVLEAEPKKPDKTTPSPYSRAPGRRHFWLRRIHSLAGIVFGGYIAVHLTVNATGLWPRKFQQNVDKIHSLEPMLPVIELLFIFLPLLIHLLYGIYIATTKIKFNLTKYHYGGNARYVLQRVTGMILVAFLVYHVGTLHRWGFTLFHLQSVPDFTPVNYAYQSTAGAIKTPYADGSSLSNIKNLAVSGFYLLGVWCAVFHFANGLWTAAITWGLTVTAAAQRKWGHVCFAFGLGLLVIGTTAWVAFAVLGRADLPVEETQTRYVVPSPDNPKTNIEFPGNPAPKDDDN